MKLGLSPGVKLDLSPGVKLGFSPGVEAWLESWSGSLA